MLQSIAVHPKDDYGKNKKYKLTGFDTVLNINNDITLKPVFRITFTLHTETGHL